MNDTFMKDLSASLQPGNAALFVPIKNMTADKVLREIQDAGGTVLKTSLDDSKEELLRDALAKSEHRTSSRPTERHLARGGPDRVAGCKPVRHAVPIQPTEFHREGRIASAVRERYAVAQAQCERPS